jgi:chromosome partitioning protein
LVLASALTVARMAATAWGAAWLPVLVLAQCVHAIGFAAHHSVCIALINRHFPGRLRARGFRYLFVDTPPAASAAIARVMHFADLILVPTRPSPHDLRAVRATLDLAERAGRSLVFVVNGANARSRLTTDAAVALSQYGTVAPVLVTHKIVMASSMIDGRTVMETHPDSPSAQEIVTLWSYVRDRLVKIANREAFLRRRVVPAGFGRRQITGEEVPEVGTLGEVA